MKKAFKDRNLYFLLQQPYPENLYLEEQPLWNNKRLVPEFEKPLGFSVNHLKKKIFQKKIFVRYKKPGTFFQKEEPYPLFTVGQAEIHVRSPRILSRKISHFYRSLVEKKKYNILYGISHQKKLRKNLFSLGKFSFTFLEKKKDILFFKTGLFQSLQEVHREILHGRLLWNGEKLSDVSIRGFPGDCFGIPHSTNTMVEEQKMKLILQKKEKGIPKKLLWKPFFFQYKKIMFLIKKIIFYEYFTTYKNSGKNKKIPEKTKKRFFRPPRLHLIKSQKP